MDFFKSLFAKLFNKPNQQTSNTSVTPISKNNEVSIEWNRDKFKACLDKACAIFETVREINGNNRSPIIDTFNRLANVDMGSPYCVSGAVYGLYPKIVDLASQMYNIKLVYCGPLTASSQDFAHDANKFKVLSPKYGCAAIFRNSDDAGKGHFTTCLADSLSTQNKFKTFEFNTSLANEGAGQMERDGQGAAYKDRSTNGYTSKVFVGFFDTFQMFSLVKK